MKHKSLLWLSFVIYAFHLNATGIDTKKYPVKNHSGFIENKGQIIDQNNNPNPSVKYLFNSVGLNVQLRKTGFSYDVWKSNSSKSPLQEDFIKAIPEINGHVPPSGGRGSDSLFFHRIDFEFENANANLKIISEGASEDYTNYYTTGTPEQGVTMVRTWQKVIYKNVWNGIDIEFNLTPNPSPTERGAELRSSKASPSGDLGARAGAPKGRSFSAGSFKYNIILYPFAKLSDIKFRINGVDHISESNGKLILSNSINDITESIPYSFYITDGNKKNVTTNFKKLENNLFTITTNKTIPANAILTIDPTPNLLWGTYYGSFGDDYASGIVLDSNNVLITGHTCSTSSIATSGAYQGIYAGGVYDAFVLKLSKNGSRIWATYYGGSLQDQGTGIVCDKSSNIYISGMTLSTGMATTGAFQTTYQGGSSVWGWGDAFIAKFNSGGSRLWATYYGGDSNDWATGIAIDANSNIFISGWTDSFSGIATSGAFQTNLAGDDDAFIAKFSSSGARQWASYWGGISYDRGYGITTDTSGNVFLTGERYLNLSNGIDRGFVAKFNNFGNHIWDRYIGINGYTESNSIVTDKSGNIFITGVTSSPSGIATSGAYQAALNSPGGDAAFIVKLNTSGNIIWGTYYGGDMTRGNSIAFDLSQQNVYVTGDVMGANLLITNSGAYQPNYGGGAWDAFITKFSSSGSYRWGTYYGGSGDDGAYGIAVGNDGGTAVYVIGNCSSDSGITTSNGFQPGYGGGFRDAFIAKFSDCVLPLSNISVMSNANPFNCSGGWVGFSVRIAGPFPPVYAPLVIPHYRWTGPNGLDTTTNINHFFLPNLNVNNSGIYKVVVYDSVYGCRDSSYSDSLIVYPKPSVGFSQNNLRECLRGNIFILNDTSTISSGTMKRNWSLSNGDTSTSAILNMSFANAGVYTVRLAETSYPWGCSDTLIKNISVYPQTNIGFTVNNTGRCSTNTYLFTDTSSLASGNYNRLWSLGDGTNSANSSVNKSYITAGAYNVKLVTTTNNGCIDSVQKNITVATPYIVPFAGFTQNNFAQCLSGNNFTLNDTSTISSGTITRLWVFGDATSSNTINVNKNFISAGIYNIKLLATSDHNCKDSATKLFTVYPQTNIGFTVNHTVQCLQNIFLFTDTSNVSPGSYTKLWHLGEGSTSTLSVLNKTYNAGSFTVKLNTTTDKGCIDSTQQNITVNPYPKPNVGYTQNNFAQCFSENKFLLNDTSTISSGTITRLWNFGDATTSSIIGLNKTFINAGTYQIKLFEISDHNCIDSAIKTFSVYPQPNAGYTQNNLAQCLSGNSFVLNDTSTISSGTLTRLWSFGDTSTLSSGSMNKSFLKDGIYAVKLIEISDHNCIDSAIKIFTVYSQTNIGFMVNNLNQCLSNNNYVFTDTSTISSGTFSRLWNLGDGNLSTAIVVNKSYNTNGSYQIKLNTTSNYGCKDSLQKTILVNPKPIVGFTVDDSVQCLIENIFLFNDTSTVPGGTYTRLWNLGDATTNSIASFNKSYNIAGNYQVKLKIADANNCSDSATHLIIVKPNPDKPKIISVTNTQLQSTPSSNTYQWFLNNDPIANSNSEILHISKNGSYFVKIDSANGCSNSSDLINVTLFNNGEIRIYPNPNYGRFTIDFNTLQGEKQVEVFDVQGRFIAEYLTSGNGLEVQLAPILARGMYFLKIQTGAGTFNAKVVVD